MGLYECDTPDPFVFLHYKTGPFNSQENLLGPERSWLLTPVYNSVREDPALVWLDFCTHLFTFN